MKTRFLHLENWGYLTNGLEPFGPTAINSVEALLSRFDAESAVFKEMIAWNSSHTTRPFIYPKRLIVELTILGKSAPDGLKPPQITAVSALRMNEDGPAAPALLIKMRSLSLDVPMDVQIPLRFCLKGRPHLLGTYSVYEHSLFDGFGEPYRYYGITKRGWNQRFFEHTKAAMREDSHRMFPKKLRELADERLRRLSALGPHVPTPGELHRVATTLCIAGLDEEAAFDAEEYLVEKHTLASKHAHGLNMIPGGREGLRALSTLFPGDKGLPADTEGRERLLVEFQNSRSRVGAPNLGVKAKWNDPEYAEACICGRENRLSGDQVREIRFLTVSGFSRQEVLVKVGASSFQQIEQVLKGRTYSRVR